MVGRPRHGVGGGWGDINIHIDINMNIDIHIIINMNNNFGVGDHFQEGTRLCLFLETANRRGMQPEPKSCRIKS